MQKHDLADLVEFNNNRFNPKVVINEPGYRLVLISILAGQSIFEHAAPGKVTIYIMRGSIRLFEGEAACDVNAGEIVTFGPGAKHSVHALENSVILILATALKGRTRHLLTNLRTSISLMFVSRSGIR
jgi:quercetin dioxygenase-like cupin family protein